MNQLVLQEELNVPYTIKYYKRQPSQLAPPELKKIHPLGKSPIIQDDGITLAETSAIIGEYDTRHNYFNLLCLIFGPFACIPAEFILKKYDKEGKFAPSEAGWVNNLYCKFTFPGNEAALWGIHSELRTF